MAHLVGLERDPTRLMSPMVRPIPNYPDVERSLGPLAPARQEDTTVVASGIL